MLVGKEEIFKERKSYFPSELLYFLCYFLASIFSLSCRVFIQPSDDEIFLLLALVIKILSSAEEKGAKFFMFMVWEVFECDVTHLLC